MTYVYDDVTYVYDDVPTQVFGEVEHFDDVTYAYDDVTYAYDDVPTQVFGEVEHFVQSALDGFNVSLLAYGQVA